MELIRGRRALRGHAGRLERMTDLFMTLAAPLISTGTCCRYLGGQVIAVIEVAGLRPTNPTGTEPLRNLYRASTEPLWSFYRTSTELLWGLYRALTRQ